MPIRSPICTVVGHVDHGKSSILDAIRGSNICKGEAGAITQAIGASTVPIDIVKKKCSSLIAAMKFNLTIPGVLFIDTPGHAAFTHLRKRGGSLADIAIVAIDINEGFKPQTIESLQILIEHKTPFIIAANKIDLLPYWQSRKDLPLLQNIESQSAECKQAFETKLYELVGMVYDHIKLDSDLFSRVDDFTKKIAIVPCSAKTEEGLAELLVMIAGLAQRYLEANLKIDEKGLAHGTVLEVKDVKGAGVCMDCIIFEGCLNVNDTIVVAGLESPVITKVRALFRPKPLSEMRDVKCKFDSEKQVIAATGVRIMAVGVDNVVSGMPLRSCAPADAAAMADELQSEIEEVIIETDKEGIILKADSLGSLEALIHIFREQQIPIRSANIGPVSKRDIINAQASPELLRGVIGFNVGLGVDVVAADVEVITGNIIYALVERYTKWRDNKVAAMEADKLNELNRPGKFQLLNGFVFRQLNPAIVGVEVLAGKLQTGSRVMKSDGVFITDIRNIEKEKETVKSVDRGDKVAISMDKVTIGRQIKEGDILYTMVPEEDFRKLKASKEFLSKDEIELLKEIAEIMRVENPVWGL